MGQILARQEEGQDSRRRTISFSSEAPYRRYFGMEILDHAEEAPWTWGVNSVGVLLFNHDVDKGGGARDPRLAGKQPRHGRGGILTPTQTREKVFQQGAERDPENHIGALQRGQLGGGAGRGHIGRWTLHRPCQIARRWTPLEISVVSVPADATVGVGRSSESTDTPDLSAYERQIQINQNTFMEVKRQ